MTHEIYTDYQRELNSDQVSYLESIILTYLMDLHRIAPDHSLVEIVLNGLEQKPVKHLTAQERELLLQVVFG